MGLLLCQPLLPEEVVDNVLSGEGARVHSPLPPADSSPYPGRLAVPTAQEKGFPPTHFAEEEGCNSLLDVEAEIDQDIF